MANGFNMHGGRQGGGGRPLNGPQGRGGGNTPIPSPYNFVPLADKVFFPDWAGQVSMDAPFSDGISGHFDIKVTAKTPVYIRSGGVHPEKHEDRLKDAGYKSFFRTPDGKYAIPGTSLKGMLRAVVEIASFGKIIGGKSAPRVDDHLGLAMMYRLPYKYSIHEMIGHSLEEHKNAERLDLAELIFGRVEDKDALRGRVCVETLAAEGDPKPMTEVKTVLSGPKPTYYPNYVEQDAGPDGALRGEYKTFMHDDAKIRGWKRYIVRKDSEDIPRFDTSPTESVATAFNPLPAGTSFTGRVHIHNMRPQELGALVWAMTWGGDNNLRHSLGMGKPYGFGSVTVEISGYSLAWCDPLKRDDIDTEGMRKEFEALMQKAVPCWPDSPQIKALKAMANPETHWPQELRYPRLDNNGNNEFATFKGAGLAPKRVLVHPPGGSVPAPAVAPGQKFSAGQKVRVKSVEDPRGKGRPWFEAPDGDQGTVVGGNAPVVAIGEYCELEIASCNSPKGYNFRVPRR